MAREQRQAGGNTRPGIDPDARLGAEIDAALARPSVRLSASLEARYAADTEADRRAEIALYGRLGPAIFAMFFLFDTVSMPESIRVAAIVRFCCLLSGLLTTELILRGRPKRFLEDVIGPFYTLVALVGLDIIFMHTTLSEKLLYLNGVMLTTICGNLGMPGRLRVKLAANPLFFLISAHSLAPLPYRDLIPQLAMLATGQVLALAVLHRLELQKRRNYLLNLRELRRADALAAQNDRLQVLTERDGLTNLLNRRRLDALLPELLAEAARKGRPLSVLMVDVDHFKAFNDCYGHQAGDECLRMVAAILDAYTRRETDHVGRYGGEEFLVVLPDRSLAGAVGAAERLRGAIDGAEIPHACGGPTRRVTASFGAACAMPGAGLSVQALVMQADRALYAAKSAGRDQVMPPTNLAASEAMLDGIGDGPAASLGRPDLPHPDLADPTRHQVLEPVNGIVAASE